MPSAFGVLRSCGKWGLQDSREKEEGLLGVTRGSCSQLPARRVHVNAATGWACPTPAVSPG